MTELFIQQPDRSAEQPLEPDQRSEDDERAAILEEIQTSLDSLAFHSEILERQRWFTMKGDSFSPVALAVESRVSASNPKTVRRHITCSIGRIDCLIEPRGDGSYEFLMTGTESDPDNPFARLLALDPEELPAGLDTLALTVSKAIASGESGDIPTIPRTDFDDLFVALEGAADEVDAPVTCSFRSVYKLDDGRVLDVISINDMADADGVHLPDSDKPLQMLSFQVKGDFRYDREVEYGEVLEKFYDDRQLEGESPQERALRRQPRKSKVDELRRMSELLTQALKNVGSPV